MILQLNPPLPVYVIGKGNGYAFAMIDYSQEHDIYFVCGLDNSGEIWTLNNKHVRLQNNITLERNEKLKQGVENAPFKRKQSQN